VGARSSTPATASWLRSTRDNKDLPIRVGIGAAAGEPVEDHQDLFGATVQLAARLCAHAEPEQSLVSTAVAELCMGKGLAFTDLGEVSLKGFDRPVRIHAIHHPNETTK
jgi:class 3 adenylate cyclase